MKIRISGCTLLLAAMLSAQRPAVNFQREIRPILSDNCFTCHGPDKGARMANLRLDIKEGAYEARKNGAVIAPGKPDASLLYQRVTAEKSALLMPPAHTNKKLTSAQIDTLRRWIEQGAPWTEHWSFAAPVRPPVPAAKQQNWVRNPIDRFILAKLEANGLTPAPEADRRTLARRVSLDLTGLPPEPSEVEAFVNDKREDAYEKFVEKRMSSSRWGEHRGRYWLDAARYADTHGIHVDNYREMWPYRDWVIAAFNRNMPFDRFTIEQIAGDLLPNRTMDQQIATGFHRCNITTNEAGIIEDEFAAIYAKDRVDTTGAVFLGLTIGCATCHDHKFDPISQKDFYSMSAFFRNTTQKVMDGNVPDTPPILVVPREEDRDRWPKLLSEQAATRRAMTAAREQSDWDYAGWRAAKDRGAARTPFAPSDEVVTFTPDTPRRFAKSETFDLPGVGWFDAARPFTISVHFFFPKGEEGFTVASQIDPKQKNAGWAIDIGARVPVLRITDTSGKTITIRSGHLEQLKPGTWNTLAFTYDGSREQAGLALYQNGEAIPTQGAGDQNTALESNFANASPLRLGGDGDKRSFPDGEISDFRVLNRAVSEEEARLLAVWPTAVVAMAKDASALTDSEKNALHLYYLVRMDSTYRSMDAKMTALAAERREIRKRGSVTHVMEERADSKPMANILYRGMYDQKRDAVDPAVPAALPPLPASYPRNRMGLAKWLVDANNPLTSRVTVNRFWQELFGTGLVKTAEDFGSQGEAPSHPELLDWLAVEFRESGWDVKKFFFLMATSSTYRQAAVTTPEKLRKDPENRMLSRGARYRMDGEMVRDYALAVSGLLSPTIGGPSVKPYQPENVWEAVAMVGSNTRFYKPDSGEKLYRRSMYWFWKRSAPPASLELFNAPTREACTVRRERTNTPLQALVTMNDPQFVEAARMLAQHSIESAPGDFDRELDEITARLAGRTFETKERAIARAAYRDYLKYYDSNPKEAQRLLSVGEAKANLALPPANLAAMTMLANQLMNLDEVLNR